MKTELASIVVGALLGGALVSLQGARAETLSLSPLDQLGATLSLSNGSESEIPVEAGAVFTFTIEPSFSSPVFSWILERDGQIVETQSQPFFRTVFPATGLYDLSVTVRGDSREERHSFIVRVGPVIDVAARETGVLHAVLRTHPPADAGGVVLLPARGGILQLLAEESTGDIGQYVIDLNGAEDSDGDGGADNDADNAFHTSFHTGELWQVSIRPGAGETERSMQLRVVSASGETHNATLTIRFDPTLTLLPRLSIFPAAHPAEGDVQLPEQGGVVRFNAEASLGGARRFLLDFDAERDRDGDARGENDDDTTGTLFMRDGSDLFVFLKPREGEGVRRVMLTVFDEEGAHASLERRILFGSSETPRPPAGGALALIADRRSLHVSEPFTLELANPPAGATRFQWDLQSDGQVDTETTVPSLLLEPDAPGVLPVRVTMLDASGGVVTFVTEEFTVLVAGSGTIAPSPGTEGVEEVVIGTQIDGRTVSFEPAISRPLNLLRLQPTWSFGDGATSYLLTPAHTYREEGTYTVTFSLSDPETREEIVRAEEVLRVQGGAAPTLPQEKEGWGFGAVFGSLGKVLGSIFKVLAMISLILAFPALLLGVLSMKARREGVSIGELLAKYRGTASGKGKLDVPLPTVPPRTPAPVTLTVPTPIVPPKPLTPPAASRPPSPKAPPALEEEVLPPWLQKAQSTPPPRPQPPPPPLPPRPPTPPSSKIAPSQPSPLPPSLPPKPTPASPTPSVPSPPSVPPWLQKGLGTPPPPTAKPSQPVSPPKPPFPTFSQPSPPTSEKPPLTHDVLADDETIAIVEAQMPDRPELQPGGPEKESDRGIQGKQGIQGGQGA